MEKTANISRAFETFLKETPSHSKVWSDMISGLVEASALDRKTHQLIYLAVLAVQRLESGIPFHVKLAKQAGATKEEIFSAILAGLPATGNVVTQVLPIAVQAYEES